MNPLTQNISGKKMILLGNEAVVRGALESGVQFVSTYPGTPASEVGNTFFKLSGSGDFKGHFEFSSNEKVALEAGVGASFSGLKTLVAMKNFGVNVCSDALLPFVYTGTKGPTVLLVADDPSCHSSAQSEENSRGFSYLAHIPTLEPSDPQECKEFVKLAFQISEKFSIPVMVRTTTRVSHQKMPVTFSKVVSSTAKGKFVKDNKKFVTMPPRVLEMKRELLGKEEKIREFFEKSGINKIENPAKGKTGIIASGVSYLYVKEALKELNLKLPVLKLGSFYPLPEKKIEKFVGNFKKVLVVEELEPYLERELERTAKKSNCGLQVLGKNLLPQVGELTPGQVAGAVASFAGKKFTPEKKDLKPVLRRPQLCPGCPYWLVFGGVKKAVDPEKVVFGGDIGCYMLAGGPPHFLQDYLSCMGSSVGIAHGIKKATGQKLITFIGDGTFFHSGIPALINTVFNKSNPLIIILSNQTTAMTGHQPHPGAQVPSGDDLNIEKIVRACGVENVKTVDPADQELFVGTVKEFLEKEKVSVIIADHPCVFMQKKK